MRMLRVGSNIIINIDRIDSIIEDTATHDPRVRSRITAGKESCYSWDTVDELYGKINEILNSNDDALCVSCKKRLPRKMDT